MKKLALGCLLVGLFVACSDDAKKVTVVTPDALMKCDPLTNARCPAGEKCTWLVDALMPNYVGHIGCAPDGTKAIGDACTYGAAGELGYDDCKFGGVCTNFRNPMTTPTGVCKAVCDQQGGSPACDDSHVCVVYSNLYDEGDSVPAAAGVCNVGCNPLEDNDFDGTGTDLTRTGTTCGSAAEGCYGFPSGGTPPKSGFSCTRDIHYGGAMLFGHRHVCDVASGCADTVTMKPFQNSCNQGYLPLLREAPGTTSVVCVAVCEPENCFMGNCGTDDANRLGKTRATGASHRCNAEDRVGEFNIDPGMKQGEHCQFLWRSEIDQATRMYLPSQWSDKVGFCYDHTIYKYDSNADNTADLPLPGCHQLADGFGPGGDATMPTTYFGAADLGCVDSTRTAMANGKHTIPARAFETAAKIDMPRPMYNPAVYAPYAP